MQWNISANLTHSAGISPSVLQTIFCSQTFVDVIITPDYYLPEIYEDTQPGIKGRDK